MQMTRAQQTQLKILAQESYQPKMFETSLTSEEAQRRIEQLKKEIALADSF